MYDLGAINGEIKSAVVRTSGLVVKEALKNKKIELADSPTDGQILDKTVELDGSTMKIRGLYFLMMLELMVKK